MELRSWPCPTCAQDTDFEQPPCVDGHADDGGECPEWICTECGTACTTGDPRPVEVRAWHRAA